MKRHTLQEMFDGSEHEPQPYSGRFMYGKECLSFRVSDLGEFLSDIFYALENSDYDISALGEAFRHMKTDSLGMDMVVYFPRIPYVWEDDEGRCPHGMFYTGAGACPACSD